MGCFGHAQTFQAKQNSPWSVQTPKLTLAPSESYPMPVNLFLHDRGKVKDLLKLTICNNKVLNVALSATGIGSSLKINPKITPTWDLGTLFRYVFNNER